MMQTAGWGKPLAGAYHSCVLEASVCMLLASLHRCIAVACELTLTMCAGPITDGRRSAAPSDDELYGYLARTTSTGRPVEQGGGERKQALPPMFATRHSTRTTRAGELQINSALISQWQFTFPVVLAL